MKSRFTATVMQSMKCTLGQWQDNGKMGETFRKSAVCYYIFLCFTYYCMDFVSVSISNVMYFQKQLHVLNFFFPFYIQNAINVSPKIKYNLESIHQSLDNCCSFLIRVRGSGGAYPSSHRDRGLNKHSPVVTSPSQDTHTHTRTLKSIQAEAQVKLVCVFLDRVVHLYPHVFRVVSENQRQHDSTESWSLCSWALYWYVNCDRPEQI